MKPKKQYFDFFFVAICVYGVIYAARIGPQWLDILIGLPLTLLSIYKATIYCINRFA
jgi:hypothetical protein